jgi:hypothetical protein
MSLSLYTGELSHMRDFKTGLGSTSFTRLIVLEFCSLGLDSLVIFDI